MIKTESIIKELLKVATKTLKLNLNEDGQIVYDPEFTAFYKYLKLDKSDFDISHGELVGDEPRVTVTIDCSKHPDIVTVADVKSIVEDMIDDRLLDFVDQKKFTVWSADDERDNRSDEIADVKFKVDSYKFDEKTQQATFVAYWEINLSETADSRDTNPHTHGVY